MPHVRHHRWLTILGWGQGLYYAASGVWPLISMASFEAVTGPKTDDWLVRTVGTLIILIASIILLATVRRAITFEITCLAAGAALALAGVDTVFVLTGQISPIYLGDAAAEVPLALAWLVAWRKARPPVDSQEIHLP